MKVNYLLVDSLATVPEYGSVDAAGADVKAVSRKRMSPWYSLFPMYEYDTGITLEIPRGYYGKLAARSSVSKKLMWLANGIGIIDADYRGTIRVRFRSILGLGKYKVGERVAQIVLCRRYKFDFAKTGSTSITHRGTGGFGSTGA